MRVGETCEQHSISSKIIKSNLNRRSLSKEFPVKQEPRCQVSAIAIALKGT